jgi:hypothetical protein
LYEAPPGGGSRHPKAAGLTLVGNQAELMLIRCCHADIQSRKNGENECLNNGHK